MLSAAGYQYKLTACQCPTVIRPRILMTCYIQSVPTSTDMVLGAVRLQLEEELKSSAGRLVLPTHWQPMEPSTKFACVALWKLNGT